MASTHAAHPSDWRVGTDPNGPALEYVGSFDTYQAPKWSESEYFGGEEEDVEKVDGVYVIKGQDSGRLKIGFSKNIYQRIRHLQIASPERLELVCVLDSSEKYVHHLAREHRLHGEWFEPEALDVLADIPRL